MILNFLTRLKIRHFRWILLLVLIAFLIPVLSIFWLLGSRTEEILVERIKDQKLVLVRSGSVLISEFLQEVKTSLILLSEAEAIKKLDLDEGKIIIRRLSDNYKNKPLGDIIWIDRNGMAMADMSQDGRGVGVSLADRDYFLWTKTRAGPGEVFISEPIIGRGGSWEGWWGIVLATPVFYQGRFNGAMAVVLPAEKLTEHFVEPLSASYENQIFLTNQKGIIVASTFPEATGKDLFEYISQEAPQAVGDDLRILLEKAAEKEGVEICSYFHPTQRERTRAIFAYSQIVVDDSKLTLWIAYPYDEATKFFWPLHRNQSLLLAGGLFGLMVLVMIFIFGVRIAQRDGFIDGYSLGKQKLKKKKKT